jgi:hypothetical protein
MKKNRIIPTVGISVLIPLGLGVWFGVSEATREAAGAVDPVEASSSGAPAQTAAPTPSTAATPGAAAAPPPAAPAPPPTDAELALDEAIKKVTALGALSAELVESVEMLKQRFEIHGTYRKAPGGRLFLKLVVSGLPGSSGEMRQVCDGVTLWDYQQLLESKYYHKITLGPILDKLKDPEIDAATREQVLARLGIAGPEVLLVGLRRTIHFDQKDEGTIQVKAPDGATVSRPVWILRGTWQDRQGLLGPNNQPLPPNAPLPAYIPSQATVSIGKDDGWPYEVRLAGRQPSVLQDTRRIGPDGRPIGTLSSIQKSSIEPSVMVLRYSLVSLEPSFKPEEFAFPVPPGTHVEDGTETELSMLQQVIEAKIAARKNETAKTEPLLDQSIEPKAAPVPSPGGPGSAAPTPPPLTQPR